jgi:hypothetical protein
MSLPSTRYLYLHWLFLFYETQLDQHPLRVGNSCVEVRVVKCFNAITGGEGPRLYVLLQLFRVLQNAHLIYTTPCVASVIVFLKSGFDH